MRYHEVCAECVLNRSCLLQNNDDVEDCRDVRDAERGE